MTNDDTTERDHPARRAALALLAQGACNLSEAARLAGVSRQLCRHWAKHARIDWRRIRQARLAKLWRKRIGN